MDNRDRDKNLNDDDTERTWDNEPSRDQSGGMQGDQGRSSEIEEESENRNVNRGSSELEH
jgi:hypothetical protein